MTHLRLEALTRRFPGSTTPAVDGVSLDLPQGAPLAQRSDRRQYSVSVLPFSLPRLRGRVGVGVLGSARPRRPPPPPSHANAEEGAA